MARLRHRMIGARTVPFSASVIATLGTKTGLPFPARGDETSPFDGSSKSKATLGALSGVKDWTSHDLCRTFGTRLAEPGVALHVIDWLLNRVTGSLSPVALVYDKAKFLQKMLTVGPNAAGTLSGFIILSGDVIWKRVSIKT